MNANANADAAGAPGAETRGHGPGETSPSPERPAQRPTRPALRFDMTDELERLRGEPAWERFDRNAKTLVKEDSFRVVLTTLKPGATLDEHRVTARVMVQTVQGHLRLHLSEPDAVVLDLPAGHLAVLWPGITHLVEAVVESAFLLTVAGLTDDEGVQADDR
jgi:quercetin dioxygenase-like cupin family protein